MMQVGRDHGPVLTDPEPAAPEQSAADQRAKAVAYEPDGERAQALARFVGVVGEMTERILAPFLEGAHNRSFSGHHRRRRIVPLSRDGRDRVDARSGFPADELVEERSELGRARHGTALRLECFADRVTRGVAARAHALRGRPHGARRKLRGIQPAVEARAKLRPFELIVRFGPPRDRSVEHATRVREVWLRNLTGHGRVRGRVKNEATIGGIVVGGQPDADELARFSTVVNVRLDEEPGNVTADLLRGSATAYTSIPYTGDTIAIEHVEAMRAALDAAKGPTLVH